jgi:NADPH:quinone reductase-like Zn-dependent oxidoreductase
MRAAVIDQFGGVERFAVVALPRPEIRPNEVLIRVEIVSVGKWDAEERAGHYADVLGAPRFPYVLGWEGAGTVVAVGAQVTQVVPGDRVYATVVPKPNGGGFYAEYAAVEAEYLALIPGGLTTEQAAVMGWDALTAVSGLDETLELKSGETLMIVGASGGIGHMAVQLANRMGARVLAVASGTDGVALAQRLGAGHAIDGRTDDILAAARAFAPAGLDTVLLTTGGAAIDRSLAAVRAGGRVAYPNGVIPAPEPMRGLQITNYDAARGLAATARLHRLIEARPFDVHVARVFPLEQVRDAHQALSKHYLGKLALRLR